MHRSVIRNADIAIFFITSSNLSIFSEKVVWKYPHNGIYRNPRPSECLIPKNTKKWSGMLECHFKTVKSFPSNRMFNVGWGKGDHTNWWPMLTAPWNRTHDATQLERQLLLATGQISHYTHRKWRIYIFRWWYGSEISIDGRMDLHIIRNSNLMAKM